MERQGSGFKKITDAYYSAYNFREELEPKFYSDISSFRVTLYNLNYNVQIENVLINTKKVLNEDEKVLITSTNLLMQAAIDSLAAKKGTKENIKKLFTEMGFDGVFGRSDIMEITGISITAAGNLITNLKKAELISPVSGFGNGKYQFIEPHK